MAYSAEAVEYIDNISVILPNECLMVQSAEGAEYPDCISAEG